MARRRRLPLRLLLLEAAPGDDTAEAEDEQEQCGQRGS